VVEQFAKVAAVHPNRHSPSSIQNRPIRTFQRFSFALSDL